MRATTATVRLGAIGHNLKTVMQLARGSNVLPVIKANAYGHGAVEVARKLESFRAQDVPAFAVAIMDEAVQLRDAGITRPLLVLQGSSRASDVAEAAAGDIWLMVHNADQLAHISKADVSRALRVWIKVDTGMHRLGFDEEQLGGVFAALTDSDKVQNKMVLCSHLASADELDNALTRMQIDRSKRLAKQINLPWSAANSAGIIAWPQSFGDWVRPGYMLYGNSPIDDSAVGSMTTGIAESRITSDSLGEKSAERSAERSAEKSGESRDIEIRLQPAMTMLAEIISIRNIAAGEAVGYGHDWVAPQAATIGIVAVGYADGYPRHAASGTPVWLGGQRLELVGRVSMDMIAIDLTRANHAAVGDRVELWGQHLSVNEVAAHAGTIGYEILAGLTGRVPIHYLP